MAVLNYYDGSKYVPLPIGSDTATVGAYSYSEDEQVVGEWINGKPIYRKIFYVASANSQINVGTIENIDSVINKFCRFTNSGGDQWVDTNGERSQFAQPYVQASTNYIIIQIKGVLTNIYAIIEYTKTTDAENSFTIDMLTSTTVADSTATDEEVEAIFEE